MTTIRFTSTGPETFVDFRGRELVHAELNGVSLDPGTWRNGRITLTGLAAENTLTVAGRMAYRSDGEGLHRHVDPHDQQPYLYAMSFLDAGPLWFAGFDQPDIKAAYLLDVRAPEEWTVLGNGPSHATGPGRWTISPAGPLPTYLVTLVAGPYASVTREHGATRLGLHARASLRAELEEAADDLLTVTGQALDYYADLFDTPYPFGEYHQAFVPDFNAGAMENPGCVTLRDTFLPRGRSTWVDRGQRAGVVAHELAHMWFGDLVTMRWWDDLWLNESFAEYLAHRCRAAATEYPLRTEFGAVRKDWGAMADQAPTTHPVAGNDATDAETALQQFDGISYAKGAAVLKQLAAYLGEDVFLAGLRHYMRRYAWDNATFPDLLSCWVDAGAVDLGPWASAWLRTAGMDTLDVVADPSTPAERTVAVVAPPGTRRVAPPACALGGVGRGGRGDHPGGRRHRGRGSGAAVRALRRRVARSRRHRRGLGQDPVRAERLGAVGAGAARGRRRVGPGGGRQRDPGRRPRRRARPGRGAGPAPRRRPAVGRDPGRGRARVRHGHAGRCVRPGRGALEAARPGGAHGRRSAERGTGGQRRPARRLPNGWCAAPETSLGSRPGWPGSACPPESRPIPSWSG